MALLMINILFISIFTGLAFADEADDELVDFGDTDEIILEDDVGSSQQEDIILDENGEAALKITVMETIDDESPPLAGLPFLEDYDYCVWHFLILGIAIIVMAFGFTRMKKTRSRITELETELEAELKSRKQ